MLTKWQLRLLSFDFRTFLFSVALQRAEESGVKPAWCFPEPLPGTCVSPLLTLPFPVSCVVL